MKLNATRILLGLATLSIGAFAIHGWISTPTVSAMHPVSDSGANPESIVAASPGRVEGRSDTIEVGAAADGVVQRVNVHEGQTVARGAELAEIGCDDLNSALKVSEAEAESVRQARARLLRGSRTEEREAAAQKRLAAQAVVAHTTVELSRAVQLSEAAAISKAALDQARRDHDVAEAQLKEATRNEELVDAGPTIEETAKADADLSAAEDRVKLAGQKIAKCTVVAPAAGTIVRVNLRAGESFSTLAPHPIFTIADLSGRRVRAEVDERDIAKVHVGQDVTLTSEAYPGRHFSGTVARLASMMGRKSVQTGNPADKSDRDILEAIVNLQPDADTLPMGLRVTVQFIR